MCVCMYPCIEVCVCVCVCVCLRAVYNSIVHYECGPGVTADKRNTAQGTVGDKTA